MHPTNAGTTTPRRRGRKIQKPDGHIEKKVATSEAAGKVRKVEDAITGWLSRGPHAEDIERHNVQRSTANRKTLLDVTILVNDEQHEHLVRSGFLEHLRGLDCGENTEVAFRVYPPRLRRLAETEMGSVLQATG